MANGHIIGICGTGMSAVALLLKDRGDHITGSDEGFYPPVSTLLEQQKVPVCVGYRPENIPSDVDYFMVGMNAKLADASNTEVQAARATGKPVYSYPQLLAQLVSGRTCVGVIGSYGKSTCSSLMAWILEKGDTENGYFIGAWPQGMARTSKLGAGPLFVIEGDEYPSAHDDKRSKFMHYPFSHVLLTAASHDHVNVFPTLESYQAPFIERLKTMPEGATLMVCADNAEALHVAEASGRAYRTYGLSAGADWRAANIIYGDITTFDLVKKGETVVRLETRLLGKHNVQNAVGVAALILENRWLDITAVKAGLLSFLGVRRRLDRLTAEGTLPAYEGFGSSYEKARAAIEAVALHYPERRMVVLFEPHTFSWRNRDALHWYDSVFQEANRVLVYHPAQQGAGTHKQLTQEEIVARVQAAGVKAEPIQTPQQGFAALEGLNPKEDVLLVLTSGDLDGMIAALPAWAEKLRAPAA